MIRFSIVMCFLFFSVVGQLDLFRPKTIRFNVFNGRCSEYPNAPIYYSNVQFLTVNRTFYVSMKIHVSRDIESEDLKLHLYLKRCTSSDALDSCEAYNTVKLNHFCSYMTAKNRPWSPFRQYIYPPSTGCPLKKGVRSVRNGTFDGSAFSHLPINNFYWKVTVHLLTVPNEEVVMCNKVEGQIGTL